MRPSRRRVLDALHARSALTIGDLARELALTRTAVNSHVTALLRDGLAARVGVRAGKRRPSALYGLTKKADRLFPRAYDLLAADILEELTKAGAGKSRAVLGRVSRRWVSRDLASVRGLGGRRRLDGAKAVLARQGFMPSLRRTSSGYVLQQGHCPLQRVGGTHPEVCDAVQKWIQALVGAPAKRTSCASQGDVRCTYAFGASVTASK